MLSELVPDRTRTKLEAQVILQSENSIAWTFLGGTDLQRAMGSSLLHFPRINHNNLCMPGLTKGVSLLWACLSYGYMLLQNRSNILGNASHNNSVNAAPCCACQVSICAAFFVSQTSFITVVLWNPLNFCWKSVKWKLPVFYFCTNLNCDWERSS